MGEIDWHIGRLGEIEEMATSRPIELIVPDDGVFFAESVHTRDFEMTQRVEPYHKLLFVQRGRIELKTLEGKRTIESMGPERSVLSVPAGVRHHVLDQEPSVILLLGLGDIFLRRDAEVWDVWMRLQEQQVHASLMDGAFAGWWRRAVLEQSIQGPGHGLVVRAMALQVLVSASRHAARPLNDLAEERIRAIERELSETFYEGWTIDRAAQRAGLSRRQFTLRFREVTGRTFVDHLNRLRMAHAERLLRSASHSVTGAAFSSGFGDLSHFYRLFRNKHGMSPRAWLSEVE